MASVSLLIIVHNQLTLLKQHLWEYCALATSHQAPIIILDNGSTDGTKTYIAVHFPDIHYIAPPYPLQTAAAFTLACEHIQTRYLLWIDPTIAVRALPLQKSLNTLQTHHYGLLFFAVNHGHQPLMGYRLTKQGFLLKTEAHYTLAGAPGIGEVMLCDVQKLDTCLPLSACYESTLFAWFDLVARLAQHGIYHAITHTGSLHKHPQHRTLFSEPADPKKAIRDQYIYQWRHDRTWRSRIARTINMGLICMGFQPSLLFNTLHASFNWLLYGKRIRYNWAPCTATELIILSATPLSASLTATIAASWSLFFPLAPIRVLPALPKHYRGSFIVSFNRPFSHPVTRPCLFIGPRAPRNFRGPTIYCTCSQPQEYVHRFLNWLHPRSVPLLSETLFTASEQDSPFDKTLKEALNTPQLPPS